MGKNTAERFTIPRDVRTGQILLDGGACDGDQTFVAAFQRSKYKSALEGSSVVSHEMACNPGFVLRVQALDRGLDFREVLYLDNFG